MRRWPPQRPSRSGVGGRHRPSERTQSRLARLPWSIHAGSYAPRGADQTAKQHIGKTRLALGSETTCGIVAARIVEGSEEHIPQRKIGVIAAVPTIAMMNAVALRALNKKA